MTTDLRTNYVNAARAHGEATEAGDADAANRAHDQLAQALSELRQSPDRGRTILAELLTHEDPHVGCWAGTHLLPVDPERAVKALSSLSRDPGIAGFNAKMVLREWEAGRLKICRTPIAA